MNAVMPGSGLGVLLFVPLAGFGLGLIYFHMLRRNVDRLTGDGTALEVAALSLLRIAGAVIMFVLLARLGAPALLAGLLGFLLARTVAVRAARGRP